MSAPFFIDPKTFNYIIMSLYVINTAWWAWHKSWGDAWYWLSALSITAAVTWGYAR